MKQKQDWVAFMSQPYFCFFFLGIFWNPNGVFFGLKYGSKTDLESSHIAEQILFHIVPFNSNFWLLPQSRAWNTQTCWISSGIAIYLIQTLLFHVTDNWTKLEWPIGAELSENVTLTRSICSSYWTAPALSHI